MKLVWGSPRLLGLCADNLWHIALTLRDRDVVDTRCGRAGQRIYMVATEGYPLLRTGLSLCEACQSDLSAGCGPRSDNVSYVNSRG